MTTEAPGRIADPYVGPVSFRLGDPLYGRDREREDLLDLLIAERIVLLYSPSGAGKSSLIEAALVPALREAAFEVLPTIRVSHALPPEPGMPAPRNRYVMGVLLSLEEGVPAEKQRPVAELATLSLREYLAAYADRDNRPGNEVLIFDQFEEVLTADPTDEPAKHAFFKELGDVLRDRGHWALFSMREDFLAALDPYLKYLPTRLRTTFRLDLLSVPEALEAIRRPAQRMGVDFTEEAAQQLVDDLRIVRVQRPSGVTEVFGSYVEPVQLQVACHLLWSMLPPYPATISLADVDALGRVDQALAGYYAERVRAAADRTGVREQIIRDWFEERLITPQGLRSQVLQGPASSTAAAHDLLGDLLDAHLVRAETRRQATWYELAHDRLIEPIRRDNAAWRTSHLSSLERAAMLWEQEGKPDRLLLLSFDLGAALQDESVRTGALTDRQREFLDASRRADEQARRDAETAVALRRSARRLRFTLAGTALLAVLVVIAFAGSVAVALRAAKLEEITGVLLEAQSRLDVNQDRAVALAVKGAEMYGSDALPPEVRDVLFRAATSPVSLALAGQRGPTTTAAISLDGSVVVAAGQDDIQIWERETGRAVARLPLGDGEKVNSVDLTADGSTVIAGMDNGTLLAWNVADNRPRRWPQTTGFVWTVAMSPDGSSFASAGLGAEVQIWDLDGHLLTTVQDPNSSYTNSVAFTPDGKFLATTGDNAEVVLWDVNSGAQGTPLKLNEEAWFIAFGTDGKSLASISANAVIVWDLDRWAPRYPPFTGAPGTSRNIDYDFRRALSVNDRGGVSVYDLANGEETMSASVPGASIWGAVFDPDPDRVFVVGNDVDPSIWNLRPAGSSEVLSAVAVTDDEIFQVWSDGTLWSSGPDAYDSERVVPGINVGDVKELSADRDGKRLAAVTTAGGVRVWDTTQGSAPIVLERGDALFSDVALTPDGTVLVTSDEAGGVSAWDSGTGVKLADVAAATSVGGGWPRAVTELQLSPDGSTVFAALQPYVPRDPIALMAPLSGGGIGSETAVVMPEGWETENVGAATFSPNGESVILGTDTGRIGTLDAASGDLVWDAGTTHDGRVQELLPTDSDGMVLSMGVDNRVMVLDTADQKEVGHVASGSTPLAAVLRENGKEMVLVTQNQGIVAVRMDDAGLLDLVGSKVINPAE